MKSDFDTAYYRNNELNYWNLEAHGNIQTSTITLAPGNKHKEPLISSITIHVPCENKAPPQGERTHPVQPIVYTSVQQHSFATV